MMYPPACEEPEYTRKFRPTYPHHNTEVPEADFGWAEGKRLFCCRIGSQMLYEPSRMDRERAQIAHANRQSPWRPGEMVRSLLLMQLR